MKRLFLLLLLSSFVRVRVMQTERVNTPARIRVFLRHEMGKSSTRTSLRGATSKKRVLDNQESDFSDIESSSESQISDSSSVVEVTRSKKKRTKNGSPKGVIPSQNPI